MERHNKIVGRAKSCPKTEGRSCVSCPVFRHTQRLIDAGAIPLNAIDYVTNRYCPPGYSQDIDDKYDNNGLASLQTEGRKIK